MIENLLENDYFVIPKVQSDANKSYELFLKYKESKKINLRTNFRLSFVSALIIVILFSIPLIFKTIKIKSHNNSLYENSELLYEFGKFKVKKIELCDDKIIDDVDIKIHTYTSIQIQNITRAKKIFIDFPEDDYLTDEIEILVEKGDFDLTFYKIGYCTLVTNYASLISEDPSYMYVLTKGSNKYDGKLTVSVIRFDCQSIEKCNVEMTGIYSFNFTDLRYKLDKLTDTDILMVINKIKKEYEKKQCK